MAPKRKLLLKALNNPTGLRFREFTSLHEAFGFPLSRVTGSHHIFSRPDVSEIVNAQPTKDGQAEEDRVRQFRRLVERHGLSMEEEGVKDYHINLFLNDADGLWVADIPDLPGCSAHGETPEAALREVQVLKQGWLEVTREIGKPIPAPTYRPAIYLAG